MVTPRDGARRCWRGITAWKTSRPSGTMAIVSGSSSTKVITSRDHAQGRGLADAGGGTGDGADAAFKPPSRCRNGEAARQDQ
jgi:hypothetical protein